MSTARVFTNPKDSYKQGDGVTVNSSGKLYFREPGVGSTTLKSVYSDKALTIPLINPVILDSGGRAPDIFLNGDYNIQHTTSADVQIWRVNNYQPPVVDGQFDAWDASLTFAVNDYVRYTDNLYYVSLQSGNVGNVPSTSPTYWSQVLFLTVYNSSTTYASGDVVYYNGNLYISTQSTNTGNTPDASDTFWRRPGTTVPAISGFSGSVVQYLSDTSLGPSIDYISLLPSRNTYYTFGPTGSGATNVWTALDEIPTNAVSVRIKFTGTTERTAGANQKFTLRAATRKPGTTTTYFAIDIQGYGNATQPGAAKQNNIIEAPISTDRIFEGSYDETFGDTYQINATIVGFSVAST